MSFKYHGYYCGPGWSDGKWQNSVCGHSTAIDALDQTCKEHDCSYKTHGPSKGADFDFAAKNFGVSKGFKASAAAIGVGAKGLVFTESANNLSSSKMYIDASKQRSASTSRGRQPATPPNSARNPRVVSLSISRSDARAANTAAFRARPVTFAKSTQTSSARYGNSSSVAGGKRFGKAKRGSVRKFAKSRKGRLVKSGVSLVHEFGDTATSTPAQQLVTLGHSTCALEQMQVALAGLLFKKLIRKAGYDMRSFQELVVVNGGGTASSEITITYRPSTTPTSANAVVSWVPGAGVQMSANAFAVWFCNTARPWVYTALDQFIFVSIQLIQKSGAVGQPAFIPPTLLWLERAKVSYHVKSSMKFQNRSGTNVSGNQEDDVNNVPLYGKSYSGFGTGPTPRQADKTSLAVTSFLAEQAHGLINPAPADVNASGYLEPPNPTLLGRATKWTKVMMNPGLVKTSVLTDKKSISFNAFVKLLFLSWTLNTAVTVKTMTRNGNYRLFMVEKILQAGVADTANLVLAYEINYELSMDMSFGRTGEIVTKFVSAV